MEKAIEKYICIEIKKIDCRKCIKEPISENPKKSFAEREG
jgi:hypothetical protein